MLNKDLKLNENIFAEDTEKAATREGFGKALVELGESNSNIVVLTADLGESTKVNEFANKFPERFIEVGVAEQNLAAVAAGLGVSGKIAFISSYAVFSPGKNLETIRTTIAYNNANVKIAGHHAGLATGPDGATHQATEDIAIMRSMPNMEVFVPSDTNEAKYLTKESANSDKPTYLRLSRQNYPTITTNETAFDKNKIQTYWISDNPQATIFATGYMLYFSLLAAKKLEDEGINILVANVSTIKPLDEATVIGLTEKTGAVITCEDHQVAGGLGGLIAETLARNLPKPIEFIGLKDKFGQSGKAEELLKEYQMDEKSIIEAVKKAISRKS
jgi:transketolase